MRMITPWNDELEKKIWMSLDRICYREGLKRKIIWAVKISDYNEYEYMTDEQKELFKKKIWKRCGKQIEDVIERDCYYCDMILGYITEEEWYELTEENIEPTILNKAADDFYEETGIRLERVTKILENRIV